MLIAFLLVVLIIVILFHKEIKEAIAILVFFGMVGLALDWLWSKIEPYWSQINWSQIGKGLVAGLTGLFIGLIWFFSKDRIKGFVKWFVSEVKRGYREGQKRALEKYNKRQNKGV